MESVRNPCVGVIYCEAKAGFGKERAFMASRCGTDDLGLVRSVILVEVEIFRPDESLILPRNGMLPP